MSEESSARERLNSWKEIAAYLNRDVRTLIRWEREKALPVHRVPGGKRQAVFAYKDELEAWLAGGHANGDTKFLNTASTVYRGARYQAILILLIAAGAAILVRMGLDHTLLSDHSRRAAIIAPPHTSVPGVVKQDCQRLVQGQLVFTPKATMRQGTPYRVTARLSRDTDVHITAGLDGQGIVIENTLVSCKVAMSLDSQEPEVFKIEKLPADRTDEQVLLAGQVDEWDWRVTPQKWGTLHLLLYIKPMLLIDGVGESYMEVPQPPKVITVSPDYIFAVKQLVLRTWKVWGPVLTATITALIWLMRRLKKYREENRKRHEQDVGFAAAASNTQDGDNDPYRVRS